MEAYGIDLEKEKAEMIKENLTRNLLQITEMTRDPTENLEYMKIIQELIQRHEEARDVHGACVMRALLKSHEVHQATLTEDIKSDDEDSDSGETGRFFPKTYLKLKSNDRGKTRDGWNKIWFKACIMNTETQDEIKQRDRAARLLCIRPEDLHLNCSKSTKEQLRDKIKKTWYGPKLRRRKQKKPQKKPR